MTDVSIRFQHLNDTESNWTFKNSVLLAGEVGYDTTNNRFKIGDGVTAWNDLDWPSDISGSVALEATARSNADDVLSTAVDGKLDLVGGTMTGAMALDFTGASTDAINTKKMSSSPYPFFTELANGKTSVNNPNVPVGWGGHVNGAVGTGTDRQHLYELITDVAAIATYRMSAFRLWDDSGNFTSLTLATSFPCVGATLTVVSTSGFADSGTLTINAKPGGQTGTISYSGKTATTFTGCTSTGFSDSADTTPIALTEWRDSFGARIGGLFNYNGMWLNDLFTFRFNGETSNSARDIIIGYDNVAARTGSSVKFGQDGNVKILRSTDGSNNQFLINADGNVLTYSAAGLYPASTLALGTTGNPWGVLWTKAARISGFTGAASEVRFIGANPVGAPASGTWTVGSVAASQDGRFFMCTTAGTPGTWIDISKTYADALMTTHTGASDPHGDRAYAEALFASNDAMLFKGVIDASTNPNYPAADAGHFYKISVAGKIGGASGTNVEIGDSIICSVDSTVAGTQAAVGANWYVIQVNLDGAVVGPTSVTSGHVATFSGTTGKLIADGGALGAAAFLAVGTTASTVAAGDDSRITGAVQTSQKDQASGYVGLDASSNATVAGTLGVTGIITGAYLKIAGTASTTGAIRLPSQSNIGWRNVANSADILAFSVNGSDQPKIGGTNSGAILFTPGGTQVASMNTSTLTMSDACNIAFGTGTGGKIGTSATQKIGFWNAPPIVQPTGWGTPTGTLTRTTYVTSTVTLPQLAERVAALVSDLKSEGLLGA